MYTACSAVTRCCCMLLQVALLEQLSPAGIPITTLLGSVTTVGANGLATPNLWFDPVRLKLMHQPHAALLCLEQCPSCDSSHLVFM